MLYSSVEDLPDEIKNYPTDAKKIWMAAYNAAYVKYGEENVGTKMAGAAVKAKYRAKGDGMVRKRMGKAPKGHVLLSVSARMEGPATCVDEHGHEFTVHWSEQAIELNDGVGVGGYVAANHNLVKGESITPIGVLLDSRAYGGKLIQENYIFDEKDVKMILSEDFCRGVSIEADTVALIDDQILSARVTGNSFIFYPVDPALPPEEGGRVYHGGEMIKGKAKTGTSFAHIIMGEREFVTSIDIATKEEMEEASKLLGRRVSYSELEELPDENFLLMQEVGGEIVRRFPIVDKESAELAADMINRAQNIETSERKVALDKLKEFKSQYGIASKKVNSMTDENKEKITELMSGITERDTLIAQLKSENEELKEFKIASEKTAKDGALEALGEFVEDTSLYASMAVKDIEVVVAGMKKVVAASTVDDGMGGEDPEDPAEDPEADSGGLSTWGQETPEDIKKLFEYREHLIGKKEGE